METQVELSETDWLAARLETVGSSESPAILGLSPWQQPYELWARKLNLIPAFEETAVMRRGKRMEPYVAMDYEDATGRTLVDLGRTRSIRSLTDPLMAATIDRLVVADPKGQRTTEGIVELKTAGLWAHNEWQSEPPLHYQLQLQHQLFVLDKTWGSLACLIAGDELVYYDFERDPEVVATLQEEAHKFWGYVQRREPPPVDGSAGTCKAIAQMHRRCERRAQAVLPHEADTWAADLARATRARKLAVVEEERLKNQLRLAIEGADHGVTPGGIRFSYKMQHRDAHMVKASDFRVLRRVGGEPDEE